MMRCPFCRSGAHTRTSRYLTEQTKEAYYQCQNIDCSSTFKTRESIEHVIRQPLPPQPIMAPILPPPERQVLNRYGNNNFLH
ncbi:MULTISPECIES: ogr/Delta-like zinc finger family protein [Serratia]|uniref:ogr/Delta-like zinc finger family protein n=1 Tax=Serratia TaxID=613 RepID=UPI00066851EB|nr:MULTISPECIES: ogr/Delta-like zinc finger family protein [Serratia]AWC78263.1 transcriptional regulator [Serratia marcescens]EJC0205365.1 ogr/Delta-like zinc finger family protein [Serratia marcescens]MBH2850186.1 ogr/Delta-like zinc finger family protein [Serratia marcescens]MBH2923618.1 ogr/Delta-like zinc finger family protein [Serratia marcescens]MBH3029787.1 ogr/Delta-like zinc finger family protein [Serratia marcescens]